ncbi:MAG: hypothetical protein Q4D52_01780 [Eubacteriales bacterium]|nr:hypothetical protein [Eubacteriales bacterium]
MTKQRKMWLAGIGGAALLCLTAVAQTVTEVPGAVGVLAVAAAEQSHRAVSINGSSFEADVEQAIAQGKHEIEVASDYNKIGTVRIGREISHIYAVIGQSMSNRYPKKLGRVADETFTIASGANVIIENIDFNQEQWGAVRVVVEDGAIVRFINCTFDVTPENNGVAAFDGCVFMSGELVNNGTTSYFNTEVEPQESGMPKAGNTFAPLYLEVKQTELAEIVQGVRVNQTLSLIVDGSNRAAAVVTAELQPADSGLTVEVKDSQLVLSGRPVKAGEYRLAVTATAPKAEGGEEAVSRELAISILPKLSAELKGSLPSFIIGVESGTDAISSATGGGGGSSLSESEKSQLTLQVKDGEAEAVDGKTFRQQHPFATVDVEVLPQGSGMEAVFLLDTIMLNGTPKTAGTYYVQATMTDGTRTAKTAPLPFTIYDPQLSLTERFAELKADQTVWHMQPWNIPTVGHATVPVGITAIKGSEEHGLYGTLGRYDSFASESLTVPAGARLTLTNMKINSNVRLIVEKGATLILENSVVFGELEVYGTISTTSTNPDWKSTINNKLILRDGSVMENLDVVSHARYLTDGNLTIADPQYMVIAEGNVTVKGVNVLAADKGGNALIDGQTALSVKGNLSLEDGSELTAIGGGDKTMFHVPMGGNGIELNGGSIVGRGSLTAIGGIGSNSIQGHTNEKRGGDGITGTGLIGVAKLAATGGDGGILDENLNIGHALGIGRGGLAVAKTVTVKAEQSELRNGRPQAKDSTTEPAPTEPKQPKQGWKKEGQKYFYYQNDVAVKNRWIGDYYLGKDGVMLTDTVTPDGYRVDKNGKWLKGSWKKDSKGWWYAFEDGTWMKSGWLQIKNKWYYFDKNGYIKTSAWVGHYYLGKDGAMLTDTVTPDGYRVDKNGRWVR